MVYYGLGRAACSRGWSRAAWPSPPGTRGSSGRLYVYIYIYIYIYVHTYIYMYHNILIYNIIGRLYCPYKCYLPRWAKTTSKREFDAWNEESLMDWTRLVSNLLNNIEKEMPRDPKLQGYISTSLIYIYIYIYHNILLYHIIVCYIII